MAAVALLLLAAAHEARATDDPPAISNGTNLGAVTPIPEPATYAAGALGIAAISMYHCRRRSKRLIDDPDEPIAG